jgi:hypothetical protein
VCHHPPPVVRNILIVVLCFAIASLGISGLHGHLAGVAGSHASHSPSHQHGFHLVTVADGEHSAGHDHDGDVDVDPVAKAFFKVPLIKAFVAIVVAYLIVGLLASAPARRQLRAARLRPPKVRYSPYFLPPSHAPPCTAFSR